ncbi:Farnesyl pyrophosphate synthase [Armadillidium nasatum]|uniref:Farnesyl pyrophosphate synthase n=1 Tax=Armadillidium nasatum TaxID=96803 RepID=A0A5N5TE26_9CRUS|nr:Farnesyl pyrophosphate synthase [Armadillidium nasatum]
MACFVKRLLNLKSLNSLTFGTSKRLHTPFVSQFKWQQTSQNVQYTTQVPPAKLGQAASENDKRDFLAVFPDVVRELTNLGTQSDISDAQKWFAKVIQYNVIGGKLNRGMAVYLSLKEFIPKDALTPEIKRKAFILGWVMELIQSHYLVTDDIVDDSKMRRGKKCWYLNEGVGLRAVVDALLLNAGAFKLLSNHFKEEEYYVDMLDLFHDINLKTVIGQCLDLQTSNNKGPNLKKFTMENYDAIIRHKTSYYSFYLPVALAMFMAGIRETDYARVAGITDRELHRQAKTILLEMGSFFQVQDDYLSCFGDISITGKDGCDIREGKCTWLAVVALQRASNSQRKIMEEHYGRDDDASVKRIKELYKNIEAP